MKRFFLVVAVLVCAVGFAGPASAVTLGADDLIGYVIKGTNASPTEEVSYANKLIDMYLNGPAEDTIGTNDFFLANGGSVPAAGTLDPVSLTDGAKVDPPTFPSDGGYDYLYAKFGGFAALFWVDGAIVDGISLAPPEGVEGGGLSHYSLYNPGTTQVPEAGALLMFGSGLIGLVGYRRMRRMQ
jgi:PEP-CTERM motif